jgi:tetratricopeptide (TPR) repeat protein
MSSPAPTHYEVLGVSPAASADEIKKRFRQLARENHPDVNKSPNAAHRFRAISEANSVLSNPDSRARYDADLALAARARAARAQHQQANTFRQGPASASASSSPSSRPHSAPKPGAKPHPAQKAPQAEALQMVEEARRDFSRLRYKEAELRCRQALRIYRRIPAAYELLGDIAQRRGQTDEAIALYSYALQLEPGNRSVHIKFDKLTGRPSGATMAGHAAQASRAATSDGVPSSVVHSQGRMVVNLLGSALMLALLYVISTLTGPVALTPLYWEWSPLALLLLAAAGATTGTMLSVNGLLLLQRDALGARRGEGRRLPIPLGLFLVPLAAVCFYAMFALYLFVAAILGKVSESILRACVACFIVTALMAAVTLEGTVWVLAMGGNVVFLGVLFGWAWGDSFRK